MSVYNKHGDIVKRFLNMVNIHSLHPSGLDQSTLKGKWGSQGVAIALSLDGTIMDINL